METNHRKHRRHRKLRRKLKIPCGKPQGILMQGIIFYYIRSLDPAVNRREYARYPFKFISVNLVTLVVLIL